MPRLGPEAWQARHPNATVYLEHVYFQGTGADFDYSCVFNASGVLNAVATRSVERYLNERVQEDPDAAALEWEALEIPNGDFTVIRVSEGNAATGTWRFRVHLVERGPLAGKRIVKREHEDGVFRGFGFITRSGKFSLWSRFSSQSQQPFVRAAVAMTEMARNRAEDHSIGNERFVCQWTMRCYHCNAPASEMTNGLIPRCANHPARTAATRLPTINRLDVVFNDAYIAQLQDTVASMVDQPAQQRPRRTRRARASGQTSYHPPMSELGDGQVL